MSDLTDFLLARYAEDEAVARECIRVRDSEIERGATFRGPDDTRPMFWDDWMGGPGIRMGAEVLLAECEANRLELDELERMTLNGGDAERSSAIYLLRVKAAAYADHPDYVPEWRL